MQMRKLFDETLQWSGTACILSMYALMNFFPHLYPWNIVAGLGGAIFFFTWARRVRNKPQQIINGVAILVCCVGLFKAWG